MGQYKNQNIKVNLSGPLASMMQTRLAREKSESKRARTDLLDARNAVRASSDRSLKFDPLQIVQDIFTQMGIVESMTDSTEGPNQQVLRMTDRKINYYWRLLWRLASEGDNEAFAQINLMQDEMLEYKKVRVRFSLKKIRKWFYFFTYCSSVLSAIVLLQGAYELFLPVAAFIAAMPFFMYFFIIQPIIKRRAYQEALGKFL